ncbi:MAG: ribonuclease H family protein [Saprospiraceae bacterium]|nr:ribonuclease H family protein [Saprospiraceae bacterium]
MAKKKFYVVWVGSEPGIYSTWDDAKTRIQGFPGAKYKSYTTMSEARAAFQAGYASSLQSTTTSGKGNRLVVKPRIGTDIPLPAWSVDAACSGVPGPMEYRGVDLATGTELFHQGPYPDGTNNIGEFLALVHALAQLHRRGDHQTTVYTDSRTALAWLRKKKAKTTLQETPRNAILFELIERAEQWLAAHQPKNKVLKWETDRWGEIPADFGRK